MNFFEAKKYIKEKIISLYNSNECNAIISLYFEDNFDITKSDLYSGKEILFSENEKKKIISDSLELAAGKPLQYVTETAHFYGEKYFVNENVLIPRHETEELVHWIYNDFNKNIFLSPTKIIDVGTGSGCIAISLKKNITDTEISACDISEKAIEIAKKNEQNVLKKSAIHFIKSDVLKENIFGEIQPDIIVSNPPYVRVSEKTYIHKNVLEHEPHIALFVPDNDTLIFYKKIISDAENSIHKQIYFYFEINEYLSDEIFILMQNYGLKNIEIKNDINGKPRMVKGVKN